MAVNRQQRLLRQGLPGNTSFLLEDLSNGDLVQYNSTTKKWDNITTASLGFASELSDLSDVNTSTPTNRNVLVADGVDWESRALVEADISDLQAAVTLAGQDYLTLSGQQITANKINIDDLANGTDGELITWSAAAAPTTVAAGTSGQILTSNGAGAAPTFQTASGGKTSVIKSGDQTTTSLSPVDVTGMSFTPDANTTYLVNMYFRLSINNTAGVPQPGVVFPGGTNDEVALLQYATAATTTGLTYARGWVNADGQIEAANALSAPNVEHVYWGWAIFETGGSPTGTFKIQFEVNNSAYTATFEDNSRFTYEILS